MDGDWGLADGLGKKDRRREGKKEGEAERELHTHNDELKQLSVLI